MKYPDGRFIARTVIRGMVIWTALRAVAMGLGAAVLGQGAGLSVDLYSSFLIIAVTAGLVLLDGRRRNEHLFLANLGVPLPALLVLAVLPPLALEAALGLAELPW